MSQPVAWKGLLWMVVSKRLDWGWVKGWRFESLLGVVFAFSFEAKGEGFADWVAGMAGCAFLGSCFCAAESFAAGLEDAFEGCGPFPGGGFVAGEVETEGL